MYTKRDYRRDVLFVANKNCVSYVNVSSPLLESIVIESMSNNGQQQKLQVTNCTYDLSAYFNYTKVDIMALWFQDEGTQLLCMTKSHNCDFFSLESSTSTFFSSIGSSSGDGGGVTPMQDVSVRANVTEWYHLTFLIQ